MSKMGRSRIFFRGGCTRRLLYFNTNKPHSFFFFWQNTSCIRKPQVISGGVCTPCTLPLDPPLKETPSDQFRFLGNCPPTPPLSQHYHFLLTQGKTLAQGRGRRAISQKIKLTTPFTYLPQVMGLNFDWGLGEGNLSKAMFISAYCQLVTNSIQKHVKKGKFPKTFRPRLQFKFVLRTFGTLKSVQYCWEIGSNSSNIHQIKVIHLHYNTGTCRIPQQWMMQF